MGTLHHAPDTTELGQGGDRVIAPTRRPDGSLRKEIRIRAGYIPQDEVAIYQPKGAQFKKGLDVPPGYDPADLAKPKTKAAKKNEKRKEKKQQMATPTASDSSIKEISVREPSSQQPAMSDGADNLSQQLDNMRVSPNSDNQDKNPSEEGGSVTTELEKRIRTLKKKIRLMESKQSASTGTTITAEQVDRIAKLEACRQELQGLEASLCAIKA